MAGGGPSGFNYDYCLVADEGFHPDVYACLGAIARATERITLGVLTNGYTRHPAVTAAAAATVNELSGGRLVVVLLAGGSMVLSPMGIERARPAPGGGRRSGGAQGAVVGPGGQLAGARRAPSTGLGSAWEAQSIPIWIASRARACSNWPGGRADGVVLTVKPDLGAALSLVNGGRICRGPARAEPLLPRPDLLHARVAGGSAPAPCRSC